MTAAGMAVQPQPHGQLLPMEHDRQHWEGRLFDGGWIAAPATLTVAEPATGETLAVVGCGNAQTIADAGRRAATVQPAWGARAPTERAAVMNRAADLIAAHTDELTGWLVRETGAVSGKAMFEIAGAIGELRHSAALTLHPDGHLLHSPDPDRLSMARRVPLGLVGVITPWNFPLLLAMRSVAPALALGNAVVLKPDPHTPVSGGLLLARLFDEAGLPPGVFTVVPGGAEVGEALVSAPAVRMITFTGSTAVGRKVGELAGRHLKKVALELGGNSAMVVLDDADLDAAASCGAWGSFLHQGQICMATGRHIVLRPVADAYAAALAVKAAALPVGNPATDPVALGPIINRRQLERIHRIVTDTVSAGATLLTGGSFDGPFYRPTVLVGVKPGMPAFDEEIFGPVAPVIVADDEDHAVELANATDYGLAAAVHSGSLGRGLAVARRLRAGMVHVNDQTVNDLPHIPMGGMGQSGNGSRFGSLNNIEEFTEWQWTTLSATPARYPF